MIQKYQNGGSLWSRHVSGNLKIKQPQNIPTREHASHVFLLYYALCFNVRFA